MNSFFIYISVILAIIILIPFYRIYKGPTIYDRMLGAGAIGTKTLVLICLIGFIYGRFDMFLDITLAYAVLNFIGVLAIAKYLNSMRGNND
ncbi:MAG: pH regulation protein F [delta proteobacterium MLS_D]|jgi:multicomponent Na+:H+ antiporter subunit F|nr:MAG: pH regulation protein F [delta proteobacterium MLS_D]